MSDPAPSLFTITPVAGNTRRYLWQVVCVRCTAILAKDSWRPHIEAAKHLREGCK